MTRTTLNDGWSARPRVSPFQELSGATTGDWNDVRLPHDALISTIRTADAPGGHASGYFPGGAFQYRRTLSVPETDRGRQILLEFDGVYRDAMIYINDNLAGQRAFGYSRFTVRIDPYLTFGADNEIRVECRTHLDSRWYSGAGIYRDVHLICKDPLHIAPDGVVVATRDIDADRAIVEIAVVVENSSPVTATPILSAAIIGADRSEVATGRSPVTVLPGESATARLRLYVNSPALWSVESPSLYSVCLDLQNGEEVADSESVTFGIRTLQVDAQRGLRINGQEVKLRGACVHADNGPLGAAAIRRAEERQVELLKAAGFNAVRSAHNPISTAFLEACDRIGMLVMDETFDVWTSGKADFDYAFDFPQWWERDVEALVAKDTNHPSVIMYSIGNEIPETGSPIGAAWGRRLAEKIRSLDDTRFITNGINGFVSVLDMILPAMKARRADATADAVGGGVNAMMNGFGQMMGALQTSEPVSARTEESFAVLDVAGMNYGDARYELDRELFPNRVIVGAETWPTAIAQNWALVTAHPHVIGDFTWTGWDYLGEVGIGIVRYAADGATADGSPSPMSFIADYPGLTAWCGDIDITGHRRPASYYREIVFGLREAPYIAVQRPERYGQDVSVATPWAWSDTVSSWSWDGFAGKPVHLEVYSGAEEIELLVNGAVIDRVKVGETKAFQADFEVTYVPGDVTAIAYTAGVETGRTTLTTASADLELAVDADRSDLDANGSDLAFVNIILGDGDGRVHNSHDRLVSVELTGPGELLAVASANPVTEEPFGSAETTTFDGRALAIIRPTGPGEIVLTVRTEGCPPVTLNLRAK
jgi:beta-galactosidase